MLIVNGIAGGCFFKYLDIPGGYMLGAVVGSMTVKLLALTNMQMPDLFYKGAQLAIGICVGPCRRLTLSQNSKASPRHGSEHRHSSPCGARSRLCGVPHIPDMDVTNSILSTSPEGLNAITGLADATKHLPQIMAFQMIRLYVVILMAPVFCRLMKFFFHK